MNNSIKRRIAVCSLLLKVEKHPEHAKACGITDVSYYRNPDLANTKKAS